MRLPDESRRNRAVMYWSSVTLFAALGAFGFFASGGLSGFGPFLLASVALSGIAMLITGRWRSNRAVIWPVLLAVWLFLIAFFLFAPIVCTAPLGLTSGGETTCTNPLGMTYSGSGSYQPSLVPSLLIGLLIGALVAIGLHLVLRRSSRTRDVRTSKA